jgi:hypothetical protein
MWCKCRKARLVWDQGSGEGGNEPGRKYVSHVGLRHRAHGQDRQEQRRQRGGRVCAGTGQDRATAGLAAGSLVASPVCRWENWSLKRPGTGTGGGENWQKQRRQSRRVVATVQFPSWRLFKWGWAFDINQAPNSVLWHKTQLVLGGYTLRGTEKHHVRVR